MGNALRVFARDVKRLLRAPAALVVIVVLMVLPSLYTWFNVAGFWNPYDNTENLRVCVVNEDAGAFTEITGNVNVGSQVEAQLKKNSSLGWEFTDRQTAMDEVQSGKAYAAFMMPENFSENIASLTSGDFKKPTIEYYVNEKAGAVSTKITDTGASTLEETVNQTFVSTVTSAVAQTLDVGLEESKNQLDEVTGRVTSRIDKAEKRVDDARGLTADLTKLAKDTRKKAKSASESLESAKQDIETISNQLLLVSELTVSVQDGVADFVAKVSPALDQGTSKVSSALGSANSFVGKATAAVSGVQGSVDAVVGECQTIMGVNETLIGQLEEVKAKLPEDSSVRDALDKEIGAIQEENANLQDAMGGLQSLNAAVQDAAGQTSVASDDANGAVQGSLDAATEYRATLAQNTLPAINEGVSAIGSTAGTLSGVVANQKLLVSQAQVVLDQLTSTMDSSVKALEETDGLLAAAQQEMATLKTDVSALATSGALADLYAKAPSDAQSLADFMLAPTKVKTESLYPLNAYGSAMAPLFMNLSLWIGAFMLMVILRQEADDEGIGRLTAGQGYVGRWLFLAPISVAQALILCAGNLALGVECASVLLFFLTAAVASVVYMSIQFALSVTMQHVGKGLCVVLVFVQIPAATGLYPVEMTTSFFQTVYPMFPFTYGINALREVIFGVYGSNWLWFMGMLLAFGLVAFFAGLILRPYLANVNKMFAQRVAETDILNGEEVQAPNKRFGVSQIVRMLSDREEYRAHVRAQAQRFAAWYPRVKYGLFVGSVLVVGLITLVMVVFGMEKVIILTVWLDWLVLLFLAMVVAEYVRYSIGRQLNLDGASEEELRHLFEQRNVLEDGSAQGAQPASGAQAAGSRQSAGLQAAQRGHAGAHAAGKGASHAAKPATRGAHAADAKGGRQR